MANYYVASKGQQLGPFSLNEVENQLKSETINWHDYIYDDQQSDWIMLMQFEAFTSLFNSRFSTPVNKSAPLSNSDSDPLKKRIWFVLKQNSNFGPFSKVELIQMLQSKALQEFDFIWHEGMSTWKRFADVNEFSVSEVKLIFETLKKNHDALIKDVFYRRKFPRAKLNSHAIVHDKQKVYKSVGIEISEGGAGLLIEDADFAIDQQVYLHFKPAKDVPAFNAICKIVSRKGTQYGVHFLKISGVAKNHIAAYTSSLKESAQSNTKANSQSNSQSNSKDSKSNKNHNKKSAA